MKIQRDNDNETTIDKLAKGSLIEMMGSVYIYVGDDTVVNLYNGATNYLESGCPVVDVTDNYMLVENYEG